MFIRYFFFLNILLLSNVFAHNVNTRLSFSDNEKLFNFGLSYDYDEDLILGINRSRDLIGSDLIERNTKFWAIFLYERSSWTPGLIYSKDNNGRVGLGVELNYDYYLSSNLTLLFGITILSYDKEINEIASNFSLKGNEDYAKTSLIYGIEYSFSNSFLSRVSYKKYYYDDFSSVSLIASNGSTLLTRRDFSTRGQIMETMNLSFDYMFPVGSFYFSIDRSPLVELDIVEYWSLIEYSHKLTKKIRASIHLEHEDVDNTFYTGVGLKYIF